MKPGPLKVDPATFSRLAKQLVPLHGTYAALGLHLVGKPSLHIDRQGRISARFVYRSKSDTVTHAVKNVQVQWA